MSQREEMGVISVGARRVRELDSAGINAELMIA